MDDELQRRELVLLARTECLRLGDGDRQTWAVERSALQVGLNISMNSFLTQGMLLNGASVAVAFYCHPCLTKRVKMYSHFMAPGQMGRSDVQ